VPVSQLQRNAEEISAEVYAFMASVSISSGLRSEIFLDICCNLLGAAELSLCATWSSLLFNVSRDFGG